MTLREMNEKNQEYLRRAREKLEGLGTDVDKLAEKRLRGPEVRPADWQTSLDDLRDRLKEVASHLEDLARGRDERWSDIQTKAEDGIWDAQATFRRLVDGVQPRKGNAMAKEKTRYFLQRSDRGRWGLQRQGTRGAVKYFDNKSEALHFGRRYVRQKGPSELVVRRADGTFEAVHSYR